MKKIYLSLFFIISGYLVFSQTEKTYDLEEVVISGSRFPDKREDVAQQIDIIKPTSIAFSNSANAGDLLQQTGLVLVQKSQLGGGSPILRGFEASRILMVVDGVRMNNAIYRAGHLQNIITMDQSLLDRIEIAYGPSSVVYGSDALGGVIHFYTKNPNLLSEGENAVSGSAFLRYGTAANELSGNLSFNLASKKFASYTSVSYSDFNDLKAGENTNSEFPDFGLRPYYVVTNNHVDELVKNEDKTVQVYSGYTQYDVMEKLLFQQNDHLSHKINFQYSTSTDIPRYDRLTDPLNDDSLRFAEWYYGPQERMLASYDLAWNAKKKLFDDMHFLASYQDIQESRHQRRYGKTNLQHRVEDVGVVGFNLDFSKNLNAGELRYGFESYLNSVTSTANEEDIITGVESPLDTRYPDGGSTMNNFAVFVSHIYKINDKLTLNEGLRYNYSFLHAQFDDKTFFPFPFGEIDQNSGALTGSLGIIFMPAESWRISLIGSTGFRTPNVDDLTKVFESAPGSVIIPNPDLKPENTYNVDLQLMKVIADKIEIELSGFYTRFTNYLTVEPSLFNGEDSIMYDGELSEVLSSTNGGNAYLYGMNAGIDAAISDKFSIASYITYTYGRLETDTTAAPLDHIPPVYGKTALNYQTEKFHAEFYALYNGWKKLKDYSTSGEDNEQYATAEGMPSWYTLNLKLAYQIAEWLDAEAGCENILDTNYRVFASGISAPGRNIYLTLRTKF